MNRVRIGQPPSSVTGPLRGYLDQMARVLNDLPSFSYFSGTSPNSTVTGLPGHVAINIGSASTASRVWVLSGGASSALTNQGWVILRTAAP